MADYISSYTGLQIDEGIEWARKYRGGVSVSSSWDSTCGFLETESDLDVLLQDMASALSLGKVRTIQYGNKGFIVFHTGGSNAMVLGNIVAGVYYGYINLSYNNFLNMSDNALCQEVESKASVFNPSQFANLTLSNTSLAKSFMSSGYYKAPDGMMFCWGSVVNQTTSITVQYSTSFAAVPYCVYTTAASFGTDAIECASAALVSASAFTLRPRYLKKLSTGYAEYGNSGSVFNWLAIGRWK